jgi:hypothetical protein
MAKAKVGAAGIEYIQGALKRPKKLNGHNHGNYLVATHRSAPTENPDCQRLYTFDSDRYKRSTPVTTEETRIRNRFSAVAAAVSARAKDLMKISADQAAFAAQKDAPNGKKTMRAFLWSLEKAAYDAEHQG